MYASGIVHTTASTPNSSQVARRTSACRAAVSAPKPERQLQTAGDARVGVHLGERIRHVGAVQRPG